MRKTIRIPALQREVPASPVISVLNLLLQEGVPIQTRCELYPGGYQYRDRAFGPGP